MRVVFAHEKKRADNKYLCDKQPLFSVFCIPPRMHARVTAEPLRVSKPVKACTHLMHTWAFRIRPPIDQKVTFGHMFFTFNLMPNFKSQGARIIICSYHRTLRMYPYVPHTSIIVLVIITLSSLHTIIIRINTCYYNILLYHFSILLSEHILNISEHKNWANDCVRKPEPSSATMAAAHTTY
jgi:hypothetical protein